MSHPEHSGFHLASLALALCLATVTAGCLEDSPVDDTNNGDNNGAVNNANNGDTNNGQNNGQNNGDTNNGDNNGDNNGGVELPPCESNTDCRGGEVCREGFCREACGEQDPCTGPLGTCDVEQGYCVGCLSDEDCGDNEACGAGQLCAFFCQEDAACAQGEFCAEDGSCQEAQCAVDADCPGGFRCRGSLCEPIDDLICEPEAITCQGNSLQICSRDGTSLQSEACAQGTLCREGEPGQADCVEVVCEAGQITCLDERTAAVCNEDGTEQLTEPCRGDQYCEAGSCRLQVCEPESITCEGTVLLTCDERGASVQELDCQESCDNPQGCTCKEGECVERICQPGSTQCVGNAVRTCLDDGTGYAPVDRCQEGQQCIMGTCLGAECEPGATLCSGDLLLTCQQDGRSWTGNDCSEDERVCIQGEDGGRCGAPVCEPLRATCDGDVLRTCDARGAGWATELDCAQRDMRCFGGRCLAPEEACATPSIRSRLSAQDNFAAVMTLGATPLDTVMLRADALSTPPGQITEFTWSLVEKPEDSTTQIAPTSASSPNLFLDLAGRYVVELTVSGEGAEGAWESCAPSRLVINAVPDEALHIQMVWDTDTTDMDLHLRHPNGAWNAAPWDCYYLNIAPDWGRRGFATDDPSLDIDDVNGYGPENINLNNPESITYQVGVYYFADQGQGGSNATVRVFSNGVLAWEGSDYLTNRNFWLATDITWDGEAREASFSEEPGPVTNGFP